MIQVTFNNKDYSETADNLIFQFYQINGIFPHSGPADAVNEVILVKGLGIKTDSKVICDFNRTRQNAIEVSDNLIKCPMTWPGKDPQATGLVKLGVFVDESWSDLGNFYFYQQVELSEIYPRYGPWEGSGIIYMYGTKFRDDFANSELGCKIGESVGKASLIDQSTMRCTVE